MALAKKKQGQAEKKSVQNEQNNDSMVENLYKKNIEVVSKNKTLSLLRKLYEISILALKPTDLAGRISQTVLSELNLELAGIYKFEIKSDSLKPLAFSGSERIISKMASEEINLEKIRLPNVGKNKYINAAFVEKKVVNIELENIWDGALEIQKIKNLAQVSHIKAAVFLPLIIEGKILGAILIAFNRDYESLNTFEKESINSFINVVALALEKSYLYQELENANEQLRELDRQKDEVLGIVAHQLATPVTAVRWSAESLLEQDSGHLNKEQKEWITTIEEETIQLSDLISMILDVSRIQLGRVPINNVTLDLNQFFADILNVIQIKANEKKTHFIKNVPAKLPTVLIDKKYTRMTVENLLTNAIKYTPDAGKVTFTVKILKDVLHIEVQDTGCGIPKADQDKIFGRLYRASNVRNTVDGNGFGLYVAKGAIEAQGGKIWFTSVEGKGTTFYMELPLKYPEEKK
jgi:signal transduction histidine kinase